MHQPGNYSIFSPSYTLNIHTQPWREETDDRRRSGSIVNSLLGGFRWDEEENRRVTMRWVRMGQEERMGWETRDKTRGDEKWRQEVKEEAIWDTIQTRQKEEVRNNKKRDKKEKGQDEMIRWDEKGRVKMRQQERSWDEERRADRIRFEMRQLERRDTGPVFVQQVK